MTARRLFNVLVLCTGNSARSILGEALFNHLGQGRVRAFSAGSQPSGKVNPVALETLEKHGVPFPAEARSKSWDEFAVPGAPKIDYIFTVCASAAGETCPIWPGHPTTAHWGIADPAMWSRWRRGARRSKLPIRPWKSASRPFSRSISSPCRRRTWRRRRG